MAFFSPNFNWTSGIAVFSYETAPPSCTSSLAVGSAYPPANSSDDQGRLIPRAIIPGASVVANITKLEGFTGNITISKCDKETGSVFTINAAASMPQVGGLTVIEGQCMKIRVDIDNTNCPAGKLEIESALIGDFCARTPNILICKDYDPKVTVPPALRATEGQDASVAPSNSTGSSETTTSPSNSSASSTAPSTDPKSGTVSSTRRILLTSLTAWLAVAVASL